MSSWLCILNRTNFEIVKRTLTWGISDYHKSELVGIRPGDLCAFYLITEVVSGERRNSAIGGIFEIASEPYEDSSELFPSKRIIDGEYSHRVKLKEFKVFANELQFKPLIPSLSFITNKRKYGGHIMGRAMRKIPESDLNLILDSTYHD